VPFRQSRGPPPKEVTAVPSTPIHIENLEAELKFHPDSSFVDYLIHGLRNGFDTGFTEIPSTPYMCKNLQSARNDPQSVSDLIQKEIKKGFLLGPFPSIPYSAFRINAVGLAVHKYSKKQRLIVDMSAPHNNLEHPSLNSLIDKEAHSLQYVTIDDAIRMIKVFGPGAQLIKTDISDAFKLLPIRPDLWPYHGISWKDEYFFFTRLVFGSRSSPKIFDTLSRAICWVAQTNYGIRNLLHLLDDFLVVDSPQADAHHTRNTFLGIFSKLQVPTAPHKTEGPTTCLEYLGIILDSHHMEARLPLEKVKRILAACEHFAGKKTCTKRELLSLLGHMNFAGKVIRPGRSFVSHLISLSKTVRELHHHVTLTAAVRSDLNMWVLFLKQWNGVSFFLDDNVTLAADLLIFTDATPTSFGGIYQDKWFQGHFPPTFFSEQQSMALCELFPIAMACVMWGGNWAQKRILFYCDNESTVEIINKGRSKVPSIMKLMRKLTYHSALCNYVIHAKHIPGKKNCIADALSRFQMKVFRRLAPNAEHHATPCVPITDLMMG